ncbi:hypothetical protein T484DRAFT_1755045 [Baffinella frigidus]|nr:hypothetical protein T484DRAFT_1755045 [Cryptophyta sp. CCMP2293]
MLKRKNDPLGAPRDKQITRVQSDHKSNTHKVSVGDVTFRRLPSWPMSGTDPAPPVPIRRRYPLSVSWETTVEVFTIPARERARDADSFIRRAIDPEIELTCDADSFVRRAIIPGIERARDAGNFTYKSTDHEIEYTHDTDSFVRGAIVPDIKRALDADCFARKVSVQDDTPAGFLMSWMPASMKARITHGTRNVSSGTAVDVHNSEDSDGTSSPGPICCQYGNA